MLQKDELCLIILILTSIVHLRGFPVQCQRQQWMYLHSWNVDYLFHQKQQYQNLDLSWPARWVIRIMSFTQLQRSLCDDTQNTLTKFWNKFINNKIRKCNRLKDLLIKAADYNWWSYDYISSSVLNFSSQQWQFFSFLYPALPCLWTQHVLNHSKLFLY